MPASTRSTLPAFSAGSRLSNFMSSIFSGRPALAAMARATSTSKPTTSEPFAPPRVSNGGNSAFVPITRYFVVSFLPHAASNAASAKTATVPHRIFFIGFSSGFPPPPRGMT